MSSSWTRITYSPALKRGLPCSCKVNENGPRKNVFALQGTLQKWRSAEIFGPQEVYSKITLHISCVETKWIVTILHGDVIGVAVIPVTMRWDCVWYPLALPPQRLKTNYIMWQIRPVSLFSMVYKMYCVDFCHHCSLGSDSRVSWLEGAEMSIGTYVCASLWSQREALQAAGSRQHRAQRSSWD